MPNNHLSTKVKLALLPLLMDQRFIAAIEAIEEGERAAKCSKPVVHRAIRSGGFSFLREEILRDATMSKDERHRLIDDLSDHFSSCIKCQQTDQANEAFAKDLKRYARKNRTWLRELLAIKK